MPDFTFTGAEERYYTDHGLTAHPGDVVTGDAPLDDLWVDKSKPVSSFATAEPELVEHVAEMPAEHVADDTSHL